MKKFFLLSAFFICLLFSLFIKAGSLPLSDVSAQSEQEKLQNLIKEIEQYEKELVRLKSEANTLSNQIAQFDAQIRLTSLKIAETEEKIFLLGGRIGQLETSLNSLTKAFTSRVIKTYKMSRFGKPVMMLLSSDDLSNAVSSYHYLQRIQEADRDLLMRLEKAQVVYKEQKDDQELLQNKLEEQKSVLGSQKTAKADLLAQTKNNEKKYQQLLAESKAEYEAIQAIIAGKGSEEEVGKVSQGQKIASIIQGRSCNSSGTHLHFTVRKPSGETENPFNYLKAGIGYEDNSGGDPFTPSGSWEWPINPTVKFNQGYGNTSAVRSKIVWYGFHNGLDVNSLGSSEVKAVKSGILFRGSYTGNGGCRLRYVRLHHDEEGYDTFYLHINY